MQLKTASLFLAASFALAQSFGCVSKSTPVPEVAGRQTNRLIETGIATDVVATANTYFSVERNREEACYAMAGRLEVSDDGLLSLRIGETVLPFSPAITIPNDSKQYWVDYLGNVYVRQPGSNEPISVGTLECNRFAAGRRIHSKLSGFSTSDVAPEKDVFGERWDAVVLTGWTLEQ